MELDLRCKKLDRKVSVYTNILIFYLQNERYETVIESWVKQWREKKLLKHLFKFLRA